MRAANKNKYIFFNKKIKYKNISLSKIVFNVSLLNLWTFLGCFLLCPEHYQCQYDYQLSISMPSMPMSIFPQYQCQYQYQPDLNVNFNIPSMSMSMSIPIPILMSISIPISTCPQAPTQCYK